MTFRWNNPDLVKPILNKKKITISDYTYILITLLISKINKSNFGIFSE